MIAFPNAKINLGLHVINKREDGFHNLETTFLPVELCDMLEVIENKNWKQGDERIQFIGEGIRVEGTAADNLVIKAYNLLSTTYPLPPVICCLYKKIPMGAGLGGGSSDAAFMLKLLNEKFNLKLSTEKLKTYAAQLGSDCAFFIDNQPAYIFGKGHELEPITIDLKGYYLVLVCPAVHSSTALAYSKVKRREVIDENNAVKKLVQSTVSNWKEKLENDFEGSVFAQFPELSKIKQQLYDAGAVYAAMSGSGSSMFGLFKDQPALNNEQIVLNVLLS